MVDGSKRTVPIREKKRKKNLSLQARLVYDQKKKKKKNEKERVTIRICEELNLQKVTYVFTTDLKLMERVSVSF